MAGVNLGIAGAVKRTGKGDADWWYGGDNEAWADLASALAGVPAIIRPNKTVGIYVDGTVVEYWWPVEGAVGDEDIQIKSTDISGKVDKVPGKGLSDNNYTTEEKLKLNALSEHYRGKYVSIAALNAAIPTGLSGDYAIVINTPNDQEYIWDSTNNVWLLTTTTPASTFAELGGSPNDNGALASALADKLAIAAWKFSTDLTVSLSSNKTFGRYTNGQVIPATGKTPNEVIQMAIAEPIAPTITLTSPTSVSFNQTSINNVLNFTKIIRSLGATVASVLLEWRRNNTGGWTTLSTNTSITTFTHSMTDSNFNTQPFNYRYTVTDTLGGTGFVTLDIQPSAYVAPSINFSVTASTLTSYQNNTTREKGNISSVINGSITRNSANVSLLSYQLQYSLNGGGWTNFGGSQTISGSTPTISSFTHNDSSLLTADSITYRIVVTDAYTTNASGSIGVNFYYVYVYGYNTTNGVLTGSQVYALGNDILANSPARNLSGVTAAAGYWTFIAFDAGLPAISNIIQNGATPVYGAFNNAPIATNISVTNQYGVSRNYQLYKTNASQAFTNSTLAIT